MDSAKKWKKLACAVGNSGESMILFNDEDRRPVLEITNERVMKRNVWQREVWITKKIFKWLLGSSTTVLVELPNLELLWVWESTNKRGTRCLNWQ